MMTLNRKQQPAPAINLAAFKFNLGGLLKRKMSRKKHIDAIADSPADIQIHINDMRDSSMESNNNPSSQQNSSIFSSADNGVSFYHSLETVRGSGNHDDHSEHYANFRTECISLSNSEMTSALECEESERLHGSNSYFFSNGTVDTDSVDGTIPCDAKLEEPKSDYKVGGYHPVKLNDTFTSDLNRYQVIRKLGWGHYSTVWLCKSLVTGQYVAIKIVKSGKNYTDAARDELSILKNLQGEGDDCSQLSKKSSQGESGVVHLIDDFQVSGPNGVHIAMVFELMGENLLHIIYKCRTHKASKSLAKFRPTLIPLGELKLVVKQILTSVDRMHRSGIIHTDIKPENILVEHDGVAKDIHSKFRPSSSFQVLPSEPLLMECDAVKDNINVKLADLGNATYSNYHFTNHIQTRQYRAPEIILKYKSWGSSADVWSIGCLIFELLTGDYLFEPKDGETFCKDEDHMAQIIELVGSFPSERYLHDCELYPCYFKDPKSMRSIANMKFWSLKSVLKDKYKFNVEDDEMQLVIDLVMKCLEYDLDRRYDCGSLLAHPWFREGAKYNAKECSSLPNNNRDVPGFTCED